MQLRTKKSYFKIKRIIYYVQADWLAECKKVTITEKSFEVSLRMDKYVVGTEYLIKRS